MPYEICHIDRYIECGLSYVNMGVLSGCASKGIQCIYLDDVS